MILYFANRFMNILGHASTDLPQGHLVSGDLKAEEVDTGVATFECRIPFDKSTRKQVEEMTVAGNYILRSHGDEREFYTIIESESDTYNQEVYIYAEDAGLDLINEIVGAYTADAQYSIDHYIKKFAGDSGFEIGLNELENLTRKLGWDDETTATQRLADVAARFECELSYSFEVEGLAITHKYINIYKKRGKNVGIQLRLNNEVDKIVTTKTIANLATSFICEGGTPDGENEPITLSGYVYDDGDFYVSGKRLYSRKSLEKWSRYFNADNTNTAMGGNITKTFSCDAMTQEALCTKAIAELKKVCDIEVNYEVDINVLPENARIGDTVYVIDDDIELYVEARILKLETSVADDTHYATLGDYLIKGSGISQKVADLASSFAADAKANELARQLALQAQKDAEEAKEAAQDADNKGADAVVGVTQLKDVISNLIVDENGQSLMSSEDGETFLFNIGDIQNAISQNAGSVTELQDALGGTSADVAALQDAVSDFGELTDYVRVTTYEDEPCLELGETDTPFKILITNTRIMFFEGSDVPTYISNRTLITEKAQVKEELQIGNSVSILALSDGTIGFAWKGAN